MFRSASLLIFSASSRCQAPLHARKDELRGLGALKFSCAPCGKTWTAREATAFDFSTCQQAFHPMPSIPLRNFSARRMQHRPAAGLRLLN
jgi:hypothetical protein